jgi:hypothetical protein
MTDIAFSPGFAGSFRYSACHSMRAVYPSPEVWISPDIFRPSGYVSRILIIQFCFRGFETKRAFQGE